MANTNVLDQRIEALKNELTDAIKNRDNIAKQFDNQQLEIFRIQTSIKELEGLKKDMLGEVSGDTEDTTEQG